MTRTRRRTADDAVSVAFVGTGRRAAYLYARILDGLGPQVRCVAVWGRSEEAAARLGDRLALPSYTDLEKLVSEHAPDIAIVCVRRPANGPVARLALEHGMHVLVETPVAEDPAEADELATYARSQGLKIEVAEQFHRRPLEQIKLKLIAAGLFGEVHTSFNDFAGHGYHGVSVLRSYLGFDTRPLRVIGAVREYPLDPHVALVSGTHGARTETQEHGIIEFEGGKLGLYHWTSVGYDSAARWWRSSRFLGERGMGLSTGIGIETQEQLSIIAPGGEAPQFITIQRVWERVDGGALRAIKAHTGDARMPIVVWENPFATGENGDNVQWHDDEIGVAGCVMSLVHAVRDGTEPTYGATQGRIDQEVVLAIRTSSDNGGAPVELSLA